MAERAAEGVVNMAAVPGDHKLSLPAGALHIKLLRRLAAGNSALRKMLENPVDGSLHIDRVMREPWESVLQPLSWVQVREAWAEVRADA
jgi:hypothetical protein